MEITRSTLVADLAASEPATIKVFQKNHIDFCCGGKIPLEDACAREGVDLNALVEELRAVAAADDDPVDWQKVPLTRCCRSRRRSRASPTRCSTT